MSSPTPNKGYTYPAHGGAVGAWDTPLNTNFDYIDLNVGGSYPITISSTATTVTYNSSGVIMSSTAASITIPTSLAENLFYNITGTITRALTVNMSSAGGIYVFGNNSSGAFDTSVQPNGGSGVTLKQGGQAVVVCTSTGANFADNAANNFIANSISVSSAAEFTGTNKMGMVKGTTGQRPGSPVSGDIRYNSTLNGLEFYNGTSWITVGLSNTVQRFTSGSGTCTPSTGVRRWRVRMCGAGGGGGAAAANNGTAGSDTTFGSWTAKGGGLGTAAGGAPGTGGSGGGDGTGTLVERADGGRGATGLNGSVAGVIAPGGVGGTNAFGTNGGSAVGTAPASPANTGCGGAGAGGSSGTRTGSGGGAGEYVEFWVDNPTATAYSIGGGGTGGSAGGGGGFAGANGAAGFIVVEEFYD